MRLFCKLKFSAILCKLRARVLGTQMLGHLLSEPQITQDSRCANRLQGSWQEQDLGSTHLSGQQQTLGFCQPEETFWYSRHDKADHCGINFLLQFLRFLGQDKRQKQSTKVAEGPACPQQLGIVSC